MTPSPVSSPPRLQDENDKDRAINQIEEERMRNEDNWSFESTAVAASARWLLDLELQQPDSPVHTFMIGKDIGSDELKDALEETIAALSQGNGDTSELQIELEGIFSGKEDSPLTILKQMYSRIFERFVRIQRHKDFPEELFMVDLTFLPEWFFFDDKASDTCNTMLQKYFAACMSGNNSIAPKMKTSHMRHCSGSSKDPARQYHQDFCFNTNEKHTFCLKDIFAQLLQRYASMPESSCFEWAVSFLFTDKECQQDPHVDYKHKSIKTYLARSPRGKRKRGQRQSVTQTQPPAVETINPTTPTTRKSTDASADIPWSLDMPLMEGGMRLAFYGTEKRKLMETPEVIHVPFRHALFWRGDCVHAGCLADLLGGHGFRMHAYLPLKPEHRHMIYTTLPEIEWIDQSGKWRYSERLRRFDGTKFPRGNEYV